MVLMSSDRSLEKGNYSKEISINKGKLLLSRLIKIKVKP